MTVRETLDFPGHCLGVGARYYMLSELSRREREAGIKPDPEIDALMKNTSMAGQATNLITDYVLKVFSSILLMFVHLSPRLSSLTSCFPPNRYLDWIFVLISWWEMT